MTDFKLFYKKYVPQVDHFLETNLAEKVEDKKISQIMSYSVMAGGKRLRPLLFLSVLKTFQIPIDQHMLQTASGIELIHTYSLIHDDLPAMDNDDYRRGKLTSHKKWGEAEAILAGDALLPMGIQWIAEGSEKIDLVKVISEAVGPNGMVGGQYLDIDSTNNASRSQDDDFINRMEWLKTGCLIQASLRMGGIQAKISSDDMQHLMGFSRAFGRAYQIYDDLVDVVQTSQEAGKATHKDQAEGKNNTLTLLGLNQSRQELKTLIERANREADFLPDPLLKGFLTLYQKVL